MKKVLLSLSIIFVGVIPFSLLFFLLYSLFRNENINMLNGGIVLQVYESSFIIHINSYLILIYLLVYFSLIILTYIVSKNKRLI